MANYRNPYFPSWGSQNVSGYGDSTGPFDQTNQPINGSNLYGGVTSGLSAGQAFGTPGNFHISGGNMLGAVGSGAAQGFAAGGPVGAAVGGVVGGVTSFIKQDQQLKQNIDNVNTSFDPPTDIYGRPVYNGGQYAQGLADLQGLNEGISKANRAPIRVRRLAQMGNKRNELYQNIQQGQQNYNQAEGSYRNRQLQMEDYYNRMNDTNRLYNLYR